MGRKSGEECVFMCVCAPASTKYLKAFYFSGIGLRAEKQRRCDEGNSPREGWKRGPYTEEEKHLHHQVGGVRDMREELIARRALQHLTE